MKKYHFSQIFLVLFLLISCQVSSYGAGSFSQHYNKGIEFYKQGKYDQAGQEFEQAIELKPNDIYALYGLGNTHYCKAKYDDAVKVYAKAIEINPDYAKVHYSLSLAYSKLGMTREAEKEKAIFRKLSQGEGGGTHATSSSASSHSKVQIDHAPKKTLSHPTQKTLTHETHEESHTQHEEEVSTHTAYVPSGHDTGHDAEHETGHDTGHVVKHETEHETGHETAAHQAGTVQGSHSAPAATSGHADSSDSHSIFKGYSGESHKADERVFTKKYKGSYSISDSPLGGIHSYIKDKWHQSGLSRLWICTAGYIFVTQMWLCVVAFFCVIVWRIRERA